MVDRSRPRCWVPALPFSFFLFLRSGGGGGGGGKQQPVLGTCVFFFSLFFCGPRWAVVVVVVNKQPGCWVPDFLLFVSFLCGVFASSFFFLFWVVVAMVVNPTGTWFSVFIFIFSHWVVVVVVSKQPGCWVPAFSSCFMFFCDTGGRCVSWCALCWWLCTKTPSECCCAAENTMSSSSSSSGRYACFFL